MLAVNQSDLMGGGCTKEENMQVISGKENNIQWRCPCKRMLIYQLIHLKVHLHYITAGYSCGQAPIFNFITLGLHVNVCLFKIFIYITFYYIYLILSQTKIEHVLDRNKT